MNWIDRMLWKNEQIPVLFILFILSKNIRPRIPNAHPRLSAVLFLFRPGFF
jgi:hypothetical protein